MNGYVNNKEIFGLQQMHAVESFKSNKNFFSNYIIDIFMFKSSYNFNNIHNISHLPILQT